MGSNNIINEEVSRMKSLFGYQRGRVISEQEFNEDTTTGLGYNDALVNNKVDPNQQKRIANIGATYASVKNGVITLPGFYNGKNWVDYITAQNVSSAELTAAKELNKQNQAAQQTQNTRMQNIVNTINQIDPETATIKSTNKSINGISFDEYRKRFNVSQSDIERAKAYVANLAKTQPEQAEKATEVLNSASNTPAPAGVVTPKAGNVPSGTTSAKSKPEVVELQKQLKAAGYNLGTSGPNRDGVDGIMGPKTRAAQQQMIQQKGQDAYRALSKQGQDFQNKLSSYGKMTPEQIATANALKAGQPLPQTKAPVAPATPAAPVPTGPKPTGLGFANEERDGWVYDVNTKDWIPQS